MRKILKYPIFLFGVLVIILIIFVFIYMVLIGYSLAVITGIYWFFGFLLVYSPLIIISLFLLYRKIPYRWVYEIVLIVSCVSIIFFKYAPKPDNEIYLYNNSEPLSQYDQNFIIVFGIEGQPKLDDNRYFGNIINIPKNGIYMTSSTYNYDWWSRDPSWHVAGLDVWNNGATIEVCGTYTCNDSGIKFNYEATTVNPSDGFDEEWFDTVAKFICKKINDEGLKSNDLGKGCRDGLIHQSFQNRKN